MDRASLLTQLEALLAEPQALVITRSRTWLDDLLTQAQRRVVLFGAGDLGRQAIRCLRTIGVEPLAISDNDPSLWFHNIEGINVLPPSHAAARFGTSALFIVTIWNPRHWFQVTKRQMETLGCTTVLPPSPIYWRFAEVFLPF